MTEQTHREVALLNAALELRPAERAAYLDQACAADTALRKQVEALLQAHDQAEGFLAAPPAGLDFNRTVKVNIPLTEKPGDKIGRYKLLQQIGEGGCGVVYMAEQEEPVRRRVALKVIKLGMDTKQVIARFEAERQALALMDHPNIAKVFDAGATGTTVAQASSPASSPSVSPGVASAGETPPKPAGEHACATLPAGRPYFVMELVRGIKITEFCDENKVSTQGRLKLFIEVCQAIQHAHQKGVIHRDIKPSNILVTINDGVPVPKVIDFGIAKATAGRLTDQTLFTAFEQFIGTPAYMSPEQAVMTSLDIDTRSDIYSLGVLLYELLTGRTPFDQKELLASGFDEMRRTIREVEPVKPSTRLMHELTTASARHSLSGAKGEKEKRGIEPVRRSPSPSAPVSPLQSAEPSQDDQISLPRLHQLKELIPLLRGDLDWIVMKCLEKDRTRRYETVNGLARDLERHLANEPVVARPPNALYRFQKSVRRNKTAYGAVAAIALTLLMGVILSTSQAIRARHAELEAERKERKSERVAQMLKAMITGVDPAVALGRDTRLLQELLDQTAERLRRDLNDLPEVEAELRGTIGYAYQLLGEYAKAEAMYRQALELWGRFRGGENPTVAELLNNLAVTLMSRDNATEAEATCRTALAMRVKLLGEKSLPTAETLSQLAAILRRQGKLAEAEDSIRKVLAIRKEQLGDEHREVAEAMRGLAVVLWRQGTLDEAERTLREALTMQKKLLSHAHPIVADMTEDLGLILHDQAKYTEAERALSEALTARRRFLGDAHLDTTTCIVMLLNTLLAQKKHDQAEPLAREVLTTREKQMPDDARTFNARSVLGGCLLGQKRYAEAEPLLLSGYEGLKLREDRIPWEGRYVVKDTLGRIVQLYDATQQADKAAEWRQKLAEFDQAAKQ